MRAMAVLPELTKRHEVLILAGGDAYNALVHEYEVVRLPVLRYQYPKPGRLSKYQTFKRNLSMVLDARLKGPTFQMLEGVLGEFGPDVVLTDSELYTHRLARHLGIPRITFDHFGLLVYCRPVMSRLDRLACWGNALVYRGLFGEPERVVVSSWFSAPSIRPGVRLVGPVIRQEVRRTTPSRGEHLLVYLTPGEHELTPALEQALMALDCTVLIYGTSRRGLQGNLQFKPVANLPFIEDLASCRAVFATTGNQLCGEVSYFRKPILGMPTNCLEQRLNAAQIARLGIGMRVKRRQVTASLLRHFLEREQEFVGRFPPQTGDGAAEALKAIEQFAGELAGVQETRGKLQT